MELYVGFGILVGMMIAIPFIIKLMNCLVLFKFCQKYDDMSETHFGGYSICDCFAALCFCWCYKHQAYEDEEKLAKIKLKEQQNVERERKRLEREALHKKKPTEIDVQTKNGCIKNSRCLSCCCFVFGCIGSSSVQADKKVAANQHHAYFDEEEPHANLGDGGSNGGESSP